MKINKIEVTNFRLLKNVTLSLEDETTVIVGRNNSGKTSLAELFRRVLSDGSTQFHLEDFSLSSHDNFWNAFMLFKGGSSEEKILNELPSLSLKLWIEYSISSPDLGRLSEFIIDLDINSNCGIALFKYHIKEGAIELLFKDIPFVEGAPAQENKIIFYKKIRERIQKNYIASLLAIDPTDENNQKNVDITSLRVLLQPGFINAQRGLDDITHKEKDFLGKILEKLLSPSNIENASEEDKAAIKKLDDVVLGLQEKIDTDFNKNLNKLIPTLQLFGYPRLSDPQLKTETTLDTQRLLSNHTKIRYLGDENLGLPETYNGLGSRNLLYILFQLFEFFKSYQTNELTSGVHLIFIEEPEAHLHPQMQEVFIRKLSDITKVFSEKLNNGNAWPVQFVVSTHSTHLANESSFDSIRYFLNRQEGDKYTVIKDLRDGFRKDELKEDKEFLHKYMTLTRCDLFFADKAILIEGATERILLPMMIEKFDSTGDSAKLSSQYITAIEVGGAYAHRFYGLLEFLELKTLIITDLDSTLKQENDDGKMVGKKHKVVGSTNTSNAVLTNWFDNKDISAAELIGKTDNEKIKGNKKLTYQIPEDGTTACGRSFEDAFILANPSKFGVPETNDDGKSEFAFKEAGVIDKTDFALKYGVEINDWVLPKYIKSGFEWLNESTAEESAPRESDDAK